MRVGKFLTLEEFCTCSGTYRKYADKISPYPKNPETIEAIRELAIFIIDPVIEHFGFENFQLTYGFCSADLKGFLARKDPVTGIKNGRVAPEIDQHMGRELNKNGKYYCSRPGASCDFKIIGTGSEALTEWIRSSGLPFDSLYFYGDDRPVHVSYGSQHKRAVWTFTPEGTPKPLN